MLSKEQLELELIATKVKQAKIDYIRSLNWLRPSLSYPVNIKLDGSRWVCTLETDADPAKCPIAYGDSPRQACENFDCLWNGAADFLVDGEPEEEEEF